MPDVPFTLIDADIMDGGQHVDGGYLAREELPAGAGQWMTNSKGEIAGLEFVCPCGCRSIGIVDVYRSEAARDAGDRPSWLWNGDEVKPHLDPSIQRNGICRWHGHLHNGKWTA